MGRRNLVSLTTSIMSAKQLNCLFLSKKEKLVTSNQIAVLLSFNNSNFYHRPCSKNNYMTVKLRLQSQQISFSSEYKNMQKTNFFRKLMLALMLVSASHNKENVCLLPSFNSMIFCESYSFSGIFKVISRLHLCD